MDIKGIEYKDRLTRQVEFEVKAIDDSDPEFTIFEGFANTFDVDRGLDRIEKGAFVETLAELEPKVLWGHKADIPPIGRHVRGEEQPRGLFVRAKLPNADTFNSGRIVPQLKAGSITSMSVGFSVVDSHFETIDEMQVRVITKVVLWEYSLVNFPMNQGAIITDVKSALVAKDLPLVENKSGEIDIDYKWDPAEAAERLKIFGGDEVKDFKMPIADVVDGKIIAVPRAVFAAAASVNGARGGVEMSEQEKSAVKHSLEGYYKQMGKPSPFEKGFAPVIDEFTKITDVSVFLKSWGLSNNESNSVIHAVKRVNEKERKAKLLKDFSSELSKFAVK